MIICIPLCGTTAAFNLSSTNFTQVIICTKYVQVLEWSYSEKEITEYLYSVYTQKGDYRVAQHCIYQQSELQSRTTLYIPKKWITEYSYSVYTKKGDYRVALLCIYQKSGLQSSSTLYLPKK